MIIYINNYYHLNNKNDDLWYLKAELKVLPAPNPETLVIPAQLLKPGTINGKQAT